MQQTEQPTLPRPGIYEHFKGNQYQVLGTVTHSETEELLVLYQPLYGARGLWVRPLRQFTAQVERDGVHQPRFRWLKAAESPLSTNSY